MRRILSVWLPRWPTDRWRRLQRAKGRAPSCLSRKPDKSAGPPLALTLALKGGPTFVALDEQAEGLGLHLGQRLTDAKAIVPDLVTYDSDPPAERRDLEALSDWCERYTPWAAPWPRLEGLAGGDRETPDTTGLYLDVTGCTHLFGGEEAMMADIVARLGALGIEARAAIAGTPGAAWALCRYGGKSVQRVSPEQESAALCPLPVKALRLPVSIVDGLWSLGLKTIGAVEDVPRGPLTARFGADLALRLDQLWGRDREPVNPRAPTAAYRSRLILAEPLSEHSQIEEGIIRLAGDLGQSLARDGRGARRLCLQLYRVDGVVSQLDVGTARATHDAAHLARLFREKLGRLGQDFDAGYGIDVMVLTSLADERIPASQQALMPDEDESGPGYDRFDQAFCELMDRFVGRIGFRLVRGFEARDSHIPEHAVLAVPVIQQEAGRRHAVSWVPEDQWVGERPIALLPCAEPIEVLAGIPEGPPRLFRWRKVSYQIVRSEGPERIAPEWWQEEEGESRTRDYYRVEDSHGRRFWLYRHGLYNRETNTPMWYLHGFFG